LKESRRGEESRGEERWWKRVEERKAKDVVM
jgi:hypothetical protein